MANNNDVYIIEGEEYPRVTRVLDVLDKPGLARWRGRMGNTEADKVAKLGSEFGNDFHELAADVNRGAHKKRGWNPPDHLRSVIFAYIDWLHKNIEEVIEVERTVHSIEHHYAGTVDMVARFRGDNHLALLDFKTSNSVDITWPLQLSAYKMALREQGIVVARRAVLRLPKNTADCVPELYEFKEHDEDEAAWIHVFEYWKWVSKHKEREKAARAD